MPKGIPKNGINKGWFKKGKSTWNSGLKGWNNGHEVTEETREKIRNTLSGRKRQEMAGKNNPNWKGGISRGYTKGYKNDYKYKQWRKAVFERDNYTCQDCGLRGVYLEPHHIKSWAKYPDLRYDVDNGTTVCLECHKLTDNYKGKGI